MSDPTRYPVPARIHRVEETVQRSRFVTTLAHAPSAEAAHEFVDRVRTELPDATHHCWAFVAGPPGSTTHIGMSDAGEPHGTAGRPMLAVLLHSEVGEVVAVCSRWFGGVKLGTGGLGRAYAGGVRAALETLPRQEKIARVVVEVTVGYSDVDRVLRLLAETDAVVEGEEYGADVRYVCAVPEGGLERFGRALADVTRGEGRVVELEGGSPPPPG